MYSILLISSSGQHLNDLKGQGSTYILLHAFIFHIYGNSSWLKLKTMFELVQPVPYTCKFYPVACNSHFETGHGGKKHHTSLPASAEILNLTNSQVKTKKNNFRLGLGILKYLCHPSKGFFFLTNQKEQTDSLALEKSGQF